MTEPTKPEYFTMKKIILLVVIGIEVFRTCYQFTTVEATVREVFLMLQDHPELTTAENRKILTVSLYVIAGLSIAYHLSMIYGVVKHHICLVTTMTVFQVIGALSFLLFFLFGAVNYLAAVIAIIIASVAYLFLRDIRQMRNQEQVYKVNATA